MAINVKQFQTVNEIIRDEVIRKALLLEGFKNSEVRKIVSFFNSSLEPDLVAKLAARAGQETWTVARLKQLRQEVGTVAIAGAVRMGEQYEADAIALAKQQATWEVAVLTEAIPVKIELASLSVQTVREMVVNKPINGFLIRDYFAEVGRATARKVNQQIMIGVSEGDGIDKIIRRIRGTRAARYRDGILNRPRRDIEAVVRTAVSGVVNKVREGVYEANADVVKGIQWVATLDTNVCPTCLANDGKVFDIGEGPRPPIHYNDRCTTAPVVKSWKELGFDFHEVPDSVRHSMDGDVPERVTGQKWLKRQSLARQVEILGKTKAEAFRAGKIAFKDIVDNRGHVRTLEELGLVK